MAKQKQFVLISFLSLTLRTKIVNDLKETKITYSLCLLYPDRVLRLIQFVL